MELFFMKKKITNEKMALVAKELEKALKKLEEAVQEPTDGKRFIIDSTIQRFEFSIELFKKVLKNLLLEHGEIDVNTPREIFQEAYKAHFIDDEAMWVAMLQDRNKTSHTYHESLADEIYARIPKYLNVMQKTYVKLTQKLKI